MPTARPISKRALTNENDENVGTTRVTRAKAAALSITNENAVTSLPKKALQSKKSVTGSLAGANGNAKRRILEDVSNVTKPSDNGIGEKKKAGASQGGLLSKASKPTRVQKSSKSSASVTTISAKEKISTTSLLKRPGSGSGAGGSVTKKVKLPSSKLPVSLEEEHETENMAPENVITKTKGSLSIELKEVVEPVQSKLVEEPQEKWDDLDKEDRDDPFMVSEYVVEIFDYLKELEISTLANPRYMEQQTELKWDMRGILVDWLLEVHTRFRLLPETLFLAVNIIDRFLSCKIVQLDRLQLVGVTAMFIASKYEEVLSPHVTNFRHVADDGFTEEEILSAERFVLQALDYDLSYPNPMNFLRRISKADNYDIHTRTVGKYLLEISCLDHKFIEHPPSKVAAASMYLARLVLEKGEWDVTIAHYAGYTAKELEPVLKLMIRYLWGPVHHEAFFKKYASKKFMKASIQCRAWAKKFYQENGDNIDVDTTAKAPALNPDADFGYA